MIQEEKQLLLTDLYARLSYGFTLYRESDDCIITIKPNDISTFAHFLEYSESENFKPYLRPMSSMTEEEYTEYCTMRGRNCDYGEATISVSKSLYPRHLYDDGEPVKITVFYPNPVIQDWLNKKMFDYRGLIEKGLAIEAPKNMY